MVKALSQLVEFYENMKAGANLQKDLQLTKNQYNNFQKLQHLKLVIRTANGWYPSMMGIEFIHGERSVFCTAASMGNITVNYNHPFWEGKLPPAKYVHEIDTFSYKQRPEYQEEKSDQTSITDRIV